MFAARQKTFDKFTGSLMIGGSETAIFLLAQGHMMIKRMTRATVTALICVTAMIGSQSLYALTEAARSAAAAAADTAKNSGTKGQKAANDIATAAFEVSDPSEENLASEIACLVYNESSRAQLEEILPETAAKAAATATGAAPGSMITVCDPALAYAVTASSGLNGTVIAAVAVLGGIAAAAGGGGGDDTPTSP